MLFYYLILILGSLVIISSFISVIPEVTWWMKVLHYPRIQLWFIALICLIFFPLLVNGWSKSEMFYMAALIAAFGIQSFYLYRFLPLINAQVPQISSEESAEGADLDIMVVNVLMKNREAERLLKIIEDKDPDILLAVETDRWWEDALQAVTGKYPHRMSCPLDNTYGMLLYSKFPLKDQKIKFLDYEDIPSVHALLELPGKQIIQFHGVHPVPPYPNPANKISVKQESLKKVGKIVAGHSYPAIVAGDLNDVVWEHKGSIFGQGNLLRNTRIGRGLYNTFSARNPLIRWPLDYIFVTKDFGVIDVERLPAFGSDHFPFYARVGLLKPKKV